MKEKILERLRELRSLEGESLAAADFAAGRSIDLMKAFCNREELPEELLGVGISLAGRMLDCGMGATEGSSLKSIKEGDISLSYATEGFGQNATESEMLAQFMVELERFRRLPG